MEHNYCKNLKKRGGGHNFGIMMKKSQKHVVNAWKSKKGQSAHQFWRICTHCCCFAGSRLFFLALLDHTLIMNVYADGFSSIPQSYDTDYKTKALNIKLYIYRDILVWIFTHIHLWFKQTSYNRFLIWTQLIFQSEVTVPVFADYFRSCQRPPLK